jgi:hypothetical protein
MSDPIYVFKVIANGLAVASIAALLVTISKAVRDNWKYAAADLAARRKKLEAEIEKKPQDPKLAWDLAWIRLEEYFNRNRDQTEQIFTIALWAMVLGFGLVVFTIYATLHTQSPTVSWVGAASGVITQFIGATFMVMYKSNTEQSREYVRILERFTAVGMAVQLLDGVPDGDPLLSTTKSEMAKLLLEGSMYRRSPSGPPARVQKAAKGRAKRSA